MLSFLFVLAVLQAKSQAQSPSQPVKPDLAKLCVEQMKRLPGTVNSEELTAACAKVQQLNGCTSAKGVPIYHLDKVGTDKAPKRIFVKSLIHGDETLSGTVGRAWMIRLQKIDPRNTWRVIPVANPDGWKMATRTNSNGVDLNRNFPTKDWNQEALSYWKKKMKSDPRRNPGESGGSEVETQCLMSHIDDFKPDFLISIHTPLGVLDFDGPHVRNPPHFKPLPWLSLGNFPGSLGRYMWIDRNVPVLTIELKGNEDVAKLESFDKLQDISGTVAIQAAELKKTDNPSTNKR